MQAIDYKKLNHKSFCFCTCRYSKFSFFVNGLLTSFLTTSGLIGNILFTVQLHRSPHFSRRLVSKTHLFLYKQ